MTQLTEYNRYISLRLLPVVVLFFLFQFVLRISFIVWEYGNIDISPWEVAKMFTVGAVFDVTALSFFILPYILYLTLLPRKYHLGRFDRFITHAAYAVFVYLLTYDVVAEWVFWDEFHVRYNFIAVDYLVYTHEVLANIWESYPVIMWLLAIAAVSGILYYFSRRVLFVAGNGVAALPVRAVWSAAYFAVPVFLFFVVELPQSEISGNNYANEIAKNGIFSLFSAFRNNELDYEKFYLSSYADTPLPSLHDLLEEEEMGQKFISDDPDDITRFIPGNGVAKYKNVIIVVMESMSANFMRRYGGKHNLTPNLDLIAETSLSFDNIYATGTRTTRGLEAITLSIPPSPGRSIVKRPHNENLFSLGFIFRDRGYDTRFIYGGYGYFENMNHFFGSNGFGIIDRSDFADNEQTFANAWGLCDEDLFAKVISEASKSHARGKPFMHLVMTTSNHRPYTFPPNEAGIPVEGGGRFAGVRYADYAIGKFLKQARRKPWFDDTVFVFIADHTAGSAGKTELAVEKYHIPLFIYSPSFIKPQAINSLASQIDMAPILLGLLDFSYYSKFYGENILEDTDETPHAFIANYQKLGFITDDELVILRPGKSFSAYHWKEGKKDSEPDIDLLLESIAFYRHAAGWRTRLERINTVAQPSAVTARLKK